MRHGGVAGLVFGQGQVQAGGRAGVAEGDGAAQGHQRLGRAALAEQGAAERGMFRRPPRRCPRAPFGRGEGEVSHRFHPLQHEQQPWHVGLRLGAQHLAAFGAQREAGRGCGLPHVAEPVREAALAAQEPATGVVAGLAFGDFLHREQQQPTRRQPGVSQRQHLVQHAEIAEHVGGQDHRPGGGVAGQEFLQLGMDQGGVERLAARLVQHAARDIHPGERPGRQVGQHHGHQPGAAAEIEHRPDGVTPRQRGAMLQQGSAQQPGHAVVQADEMGFETPGIAVEHGFQVRRRRARGLRQHAGGNHEMAHIRVFGRQLQRLGIGIAGLGVAAQAGQRVAAEAEHAGVGDARLPCRLGQVRGLGEGALAHRHHDRRRAQADGAGVAGDALGQHGVGRCDVAGALQRHGQRAQAGDAVRIGGGGLAQARHRVFRPVHLQQDYAQHRLGLRVAGVEDHRVGGVGGRTRHVVGLHARIGAADAQRHRIPVPRQPGIEFGQRLGHAALAQQQAGFHVAQIGGADRGLARLFARLFAPLFAPLAGQRRSAPNSGRAAWMRPAAVISRTRRASRSQSGRAMSGTA